LDPIRSTPPPGALREVVFLFFRLGATTFGGPPAHIALMEEECVHRRAWLSRQQFLDLVGVTNLIPGPNSTEVAIHLAYLRAGWWGLILGGLAFILPAALLTVALAALFQQQGALPSIGDFAAGLKPAVLAVVLVAMLRLAKTALRSWLSRGLALLALLGALLGGDELAVLGAVGFLGMVIALLRAPPAREKTAPGPASPETPQKPSQKGSPQEETRPDEDKPAQSPGLLLPVLGAAGGTAGTVALSSWALFGFFLKIGSVLYGSGYVLLSFLRGGLVESRGWMTEAQLLDAISLGQMTPGPVFTAATAAGYFIDGWWGAFAATAGIFLPAFVFVWLLGSVLGWLQRTRWFRVLLDGVNAASLGLLGAVTVELGRGALVDVWGGLVFLASALGLWRTKYNPTWFVLAGGSLGVLRGLLG
jgi:chromate transporter